jgi:hypothetical protein
MPTRAKANAGRAAKGRATTMHSKIIRLRARRCENCGTLDRLQCAHIVGRIYSHTRTDLDNAFCLCARCHMRFTDRPVEWVDFIDRKIGRAEYERLRHKAEAGVGVKFDWVAEAARLKPILKRAEDDEFLCEDHCIERCLGACGVAA